MNLDELTAVWKSQDAAPLHDVNKTLLQQALQQDEARLQKRRRRDKRIIYATSAFVVGLLAFFLILMTQNHARYVLTGWDYVTGIAGAAAALVAAGAMYAGHRAQARREQRFGDSLRDQINRRIAQLDDTATGAPRRDALMLVMTGVICPIAIFQLSARVNHKAFFSEVSYVPAILVIWCLWIGVRGVRRSVQRATSRKRELETLLKELDDQ